MEQERQTSRFRTRLARVLAAIALLLLLLLLRSTLIPPTAPERSPADDSRRRGETAADSSHARGEGTTRGEERAVHGDPIRGPRGARVGEGDDPRGGAAGDIRDADGGSEGGTFGQSDRKGRRRLRPQVTGGGGTTSAVDITLEWLADHQGADGSWNPASLRNRRTGVRTDGGGRSAHRTGVTGVALMAFLGAGETHKTGKYRKTVKAALEYLRKTQDRDGRFVPAAAEKALLGHVWATQALAEHYALTASPLCLPALRKAAAHLIGERTDDGGWPRIEGSRATDTELTIWTLLALQAAKSGDKTLVPDGVLDDALAWLSTVTDGPSGLVCSTRHPRYDLDCDLWLTAGAALARTLITNSNGSDALRMAAEQCRRRLPVWEEGRIDVHLWHLGTYALFQRGDDTWRTWNTAMKEAVIRNQRKEGDERGSWDPVGPWADQGGRVWSTAMLGMCQQVYYRYSRVPDR